MSSMKQLSPFMQAFDQLPNTLAIFPLNNAVVMPGTHLPLNIFEPRYLNMFQDAIESHRLIGMIQPRDGSANSGLYDIGCAARITRYEETLDGRLEVSLTGLCRFEISEEITTTRGYRLIIPSWSNFKIDYNEEDVSDDSEHSFVHALKHYFNNTELNLDWKAMEKLSPDNLFNSLYYFIELTPAEKQMLLEIDTSKQRIKALTALLSMNVNDNNISH